MVDYSSNSYFSVAKKGQLAEEQTTPTPPTAIDPNIIYDRFIRTNDTGDKVFYVEQGNAHWIKNPETLAALGGDFGKVITVAYEVVKTLNQRCDALDMKNFEEFKIKEEVKVEEPIVDEAEEIKEEEVQATQDRVPSNQTATATQSISPNDTALNEREENYISYIIVIDKFDQEYLNKISNYMKRFKEAISIERSEFIVVANGTELPPNSYQFNYGTKVIVNKEQLPYVDAIAQAGRASKGEFILQIL